MKILKHFSKKDILFAFIITILIVFWQFFTVVINDDFKTYYTKSQKEDGYHCGWKVFRYGFPLVFVDAHDEVLKEMGVSKFVNYLRLFLNPFLIFILILFFTVKFEFYKFIKKNINKQKIKQKIFNLILFFCLFYFLSFVINNFSYFVYERGYTIMSTEAIMGIPIFFAIIIFIYFTLLVLIISLIEKYRKIKEGKLSFKNIFKCFYLYLAILIFIPFILFLISFFYSLVF